MAHVTDAEEDKQSVEVLPGILTASGVYTMYPCALKRLIAAGTLLEVIRQAQNSRFKDLVDEYEDGLNERAAILKSLPQTFAICDNLNCTETRAEHGVEHRNDVTSLYPTLGTHEWIPIIQTTEMWLRVDYQPLTLLPPDHNGYQPEFGDEEIYWRRPIIEDNQRQFDQAYLKPRLREVVNGLKDGTLRERLLPDNPEGEVRVSELMLHMGLDLAVFLTVPLRRVNPSARWEACYGVARYSPLEESEIQARNLRARGLGRGSWARYQRSHEVPTS
ncbi:hypothetical protein NMY22_g3581 [Coprinellus aureogranulatus]|nr:hypothetical protein NMY22_g3581 [Coprinellus aureogranulatus]